MSDAGYYDDTEGMNNTNEQKGGEHKMKNEIKTETVKKAIFGITPSLIYDHGLAPMEAMSVAMYELGYRNVEITEIMSEILGRELSRQQVNDYYKRGKKKLESEGGSDVQVD